MKTKLIEVLESLGYIQGETLFLQGTMGEDKVYPESFVTFWVNETNAYSHYDNDEHSFNWYFDVIFYSSSALKTNTEPERIRKALKAADFVFDGKGFDIPSDEPTHTGWAMSVSYKDYE